MIRMKTIIITIFLYFFAAELYAQPAPCMGENIIILEGISNIDTSDLNIYVGKITYNGSTGINWGEIENENDFDYDKLKISHSHFDGCYSHTYLEHSSGKIYLVGYFIHNSILVIQSNNKTMYIVLPDFSRQIQLSAFLMHPIIDANNAHNKEERGYYTPYLYLPKISFSEGIYFLEDFQIHEDQSLNKKEVLASESIGFYQDSNMHPNPLMYWSDTLHFFAPYNVSKRLPYAKKIKGHFSESAVIEQMIKNNSNNWDILDFYLGFKVFRSNTNNELKTFLHEIQLHFEQQIKSLFKRYEDGEIDQDQLIVLYNNLEKEQLILILEKDFQLMLLFVKYLKSSQTDIQNFIALFDSTNFTVDKKALQSFLNEL